MSDVQITLAPLDSTDLGLVRAWRNDRRIYQWCRQHTVISDAEQVRWFNRQSEDPSIQMFKVMLHTAEKTGPVGVCGLTSIDPVNRRAEFSLYVAPAAQGKGIGRGALSLLLDYAFDDRGLNVVWGETFEGNPAAFGFYKLGFRYEGTRRQYYFRGGRFIDADLVSITAEEWRGARRAAGADASGGLPAVGGGQSPDGAAPVEAVPPPTPTQGVKSILRRRAFGPAGEDPSPAA